jgi:hypothetical protein
VKAPLAPLKPKGARSARVHQVWTSASGKSQKFFSRKVDLDADVPKKMFYSFWLQVNVTTFYGLCFGRSIMPSGFDHVRGARKVEALFGWSQVLVTGIGWIFAGVFTYLQLQKYSLLDVVHLLQGQTLIHIALLLYYYAWILAQPFEVQMSRAVYIADPGQGKPPPSLFFLIPILLVLGVILFLVQENERYLSIAFTVFYIFDLGLWLNIARLARVYEKASAEIYENEHLDAQLAQLHCYVRSYLRGT